MEYFTNHGPRKVQHSPGLTAGSLRPETRIGQSGQHRAALAFVLKRNQRCPAVLGVAEVENLGVSLQNRVNDLALDSDASPVHDPHFAKALQQGLVQILFHHACHIARLEGVQVDPIFDGELYRFVHDCMPAPGKDESDYIAKPSAGIGRNGKLHDNDL